MYLMDIDKWHKLIGNLDQNWCFLVERLFSNNEILEMEIEKEL